MKNRKALANRHKQIKKMSTKVRKGVKVTCTIKKYQGMKFTYERLLAGVFNNNAAEVKTEKGEILVLPIETLLISEN